MFASCQAVDVGNPWKQLVGPTNFQPCGRYLHRSRPSRRWYVVTDDDTLVNVPCLLRVLDSHDDSLAIYLGERYGWSHMQASLSGLMFVLFFSLRVRSLAEKQQAFCVSKGSTYLIMNHT